MSKLSANAQPFVAATTRATAAAELNANALPFTLPTARVKKQCAVKQGSRMPGIDERSLFMTFSRGSPFTEEEILLYFTSVFGKCVERVFVHQRRNPDFGKITFTTSIMAEMLLLNMKVAKALVNNKPIWLKKYVSRNQRK